MAHLTRLLRLRKDICCPVLKWLILIWVGLLIQMWYNQLSDQNKKNHLMNLNVLLKLNPCAKTTRKMTLLAEAERQRRRNWTTRGKLSPSCRRDQYKSSTSTSTLPLVSAYLLPKHMLPRHTEKRKRDCNGKVLTAARGMTVHTTINLVELYATEIGVGLAIKHGCRDVLVQIDSMNAAGYFRGRDIRGQPLQLC